MVVELLVTLIVGVEEVGEVVGEENASVVLCFMKVFVQFELHEFIIRLAVASISLSHSLRIFFSFLSFMIRSFVSQNEILQLHASLRLLVQVYVKLRFRLRLVCVPLLQSTALTVS